MDFLTRFVYLAVIKDIPAQFIIRRTGNPGIIPPVIGRSGKNGLVLTLAGDQVLGACTGNWKTDCSILSSNGFHPGWIALDGHPGQWRAVFQGGGPDHHLTVIGKGI